MDVSPETLRQACKRFRVLIIGRRNAGKTTILEKMTGSSEGAKPEIRDENGDLVIDKDVFKSGMERGMSRIECEITYPNNPRFVFHDSRGIEAGAESVGDNESSKLCAEYIQQFIDKRAQRENLEDQLHTIWFCMPMDTPRVPNDEFELAFLKNFTGNVPVIAILTKYEALVDRAKDEYRGKSVTKEDVLNYAKVNIYNPLKAKDIKHIEAIVQTHHHGKGCELLAKKTYKAIKDETLAIIFAMAQQSSMRLACQLTFKQIITQPILLKLQMAKNKNNNTLFYEHLIKKSLQLLPFWNLLSDNFLKFWFEWEWKEEWKEEKWKESFKYYDNHERHNDKILDQHISEIVSAINDWLEVNFMNILMDDYYIKFVAFICLIGCSTSQHSKMPWKHITKAIEKLNNKKETRSQFIQKLQSLQQRYKYGTEEFCIEIANLVIATVVSDLEL